VGREWSLAWVRIGHRASESAVIQVLFIKNVKNRFLENEHLGFSARSKGGRVGLIARLVESV